MSGVQTWKVVTHNSFTGSEVRGPLPPIHDRNEMETSQCTWKHLDVYIFGQDH